MGRLPPADDEGEERRRGWGDAVCGAVCVVLCVGALCVVLYGVILTLSLSFFSLSPSSLSPSLSFFSPKAACPATCTWLLSTTDGGQGGANGRCKFTGLAFETDINNKSPGTYVEESYIIMVYMICY